MAKRLKYSINNIISNKHLGKVKNMSKNNFKFLMLSLLILSFVNFAIFAPKAAGAMKDVTIDGIITEEEWSNSDWNISFFLDVDNTPDYNGKINVDGNNTLFLGQDKKNLYIALDLKCDRSDNETGEWLGVWLNTNNRSFLGSPQWLSYLNDGTESLIHNVEIDQQWDAFADTIGFDVWYLEDDSAYNPAYGEIDGNAENFKYDWRHDFNITSEAVGGDHIYRLDFSIDLDDWFPLSEFFDVLHEIEILINTKSNTTIDNHKIIFWYNDGSIPPLTDTTQVKDINTGTSYQTDYVMWGIGNLTDDHKFQFSLYGNHTDSFITNLNILNFRLYMNSTNPLISIGLPFSSIKNYEIEWSFGPSPGNSTDHRMFELSIPKSELEHFKSNRELGIVVGGYGTMYINGTNWWCFSKVDTYVPFWDSSQYNYYKMIGLPSKEKIPGYNYFLIIASIGVISIVLIKKKLK